MKGRLSLESLNAGQLHDAPAAFERVLAQDDTYAPAQTALANLPEHEQLSGMPVDVIELQADDFATAQTEPRSSSKMA